MFAPQQFDLRSRRCDRPTPRPVAAHDEAHERNYSLSWAASLSSEGERRNLLHVPLVMLFSFRLARGPYAEIFANWVRYHPVQGFGDACSNVARAQSMVCSDTSSLRGLEVSRGEILQHRSGLPSLFTSANSAPSPKNRSGSLTPSFSLTSVNVPLPLL
jgi:hypothetical protein